MKTYDVTITATITKTVRVEAENEDKAFIFANESFSVLPDEWAEKYTQDVDDIQEVENVD